MMQTAAVAVISLIALVNDAAVAFVNDAYKLYLMLPKLHLSMMLH